MIKSFLQILVASAICGAPLSANAQTATRLTFPNPTGMVEFGYSVTEFNGYSLFGSEFHNALNVYQNGVFKFQGVGPAGSCFGHGNSMNNNFIAAGAHKTNNNRGVVYLSKHVNGQPQNNFSTVISAQNPADNDQFGKVIDMHNDWMVIGAPNIGGSEHGGYIEIWRYTNNNWVRFKKIGPNLTSLADFGISVAIRGERIVVGAPGYNRVFIYKFVNNDWITENVYAPNRDTWAYKTYDEFGTPYYDWNFGYDVDITDGNIIVGDPRAKKAAILTLQGNTWVLTKTLVSPIANENSVFGNSVAIQYNRAVVGAPRLAGGGLRPEEGKVYLYSDGYNYKGYMYVGSPANMMVRALGMGVAIDSDNVLAGASNSKNLLTIPNEGGAFRMPFYYVYQSGNWREGEENNNAFADETAMVYPNPVVGNEVFINSRESIISAEAFSATGKVFPLPILENSFDISTLSSGVYSIKIITASGTKIKKLVKE